MPKTKTFSPIFIQLGGNDGRYLNLIIAPLDGDGISRGALFSLRVALNGDNVLGPDGAIVVAPVPDGILDASINTGSAPIQTAVDAMDAAHALDAYY